MRIVRELSLISVGTFEELETQVQYATKSPGKVDATKVIDNHLFAFEWETGNISSSHRAVNKLVLGLLRGVFLGGALVLTL